MSLPWRPRCNRFRALRIGGPLMAASFAIFWFPWPLIPASLQFGLALCVYDGFLTWVDQSHSALLVDLVSTPAERAQMTMLTSVFGLVRAVSAQFQVERRHGGGCRNGG